MNLALASVLAFASTTSAFMAAPASNKCHVSSSSTELYERKPFITGNWKLNPATKNEAISLAQDIAATVTKDSPDDIALFVPFTFIETVQNIVGDKINVGAEVCIVLFSLLYIIMSHAVLSLLV